MGGIISAAIFTAVGVWVLRWLWLHVTASARARYAAAKQAATRMRDRLRTEGGTGPRPSAVAALVGAVCGGAAEGAWLAWRAGVPGFQAGWARGRSRVNGWWMRRFPPAEPEPSPPDTPPPPEPAPAPPTRPQAPPGPAANGRPKLTVIQNPTRGGTPTVATIATTGRELHTIDDVRAEARAAAQQSQVEMEDASAAVARAEAEASRHQNLAERGAQILDKDPAAAAAVAETLPAAQAALSAARARLAAAEQMHTAATAALTRLAAHAGAEAAIGDLGGRASSKTGAYANAG